MQFSNMASDHPSAAFLVVITLNFTEKFATGAAGVGDDSLSDWRYRSQGSFRSARLRPCFEPDEQLKRLTGLARNLLSRALRLKATVGKENGEGAAGNKGRWRQLPRFASQQGSRASIPPAQRGRRSF
jgi:hypothetical protein